MTEQRFLSDRRDFETARLGRNANGIILSGQAKSDIRFALITVLLSNTGEICECTLCDDLTSLQERLNEADGGHIIASA